MGLSGGGEFAGLNVGDSVVSYVVEILLLPGSFGGTFWETILLVKGYLLFVFLSFCFF
jgi:hypothetical protein